MRHLVGKLLVPAVLTLGAHDAMACSRTWASFAEKYEESANIFTAVVDDRRHTQMGNAATIATSRFTITEVFKGVQPFNVIVSHPAGSCGLYLEVGVEYLFFVPDSGEVHLLSGTRKSEDAVPELAALRSFAKGTSPTLEELWHFWSADEGCTLHTSFRVAGDAVGSVMFEGTRPSASGTRTRDSMFLRISLPEVDAGEHVNLNVDGTVYQATVQRQGPLSRFYFVAEDDAMQVLKRLLSAEVLSIDVQREGADSDLHIEVNAANVARAGTAEKMLECMTSAAASTKVAAVDANPSGFGLGAGSPYVPGFDQLRIGDSLTSVVDVFTDAIYDGRAWSVRVDHPLFSAIRYSSRGMPAGPDGKDGLIKSVEYRFEPETDADEAAARFHAEAIEKWPTVARETGANGRRTVWRDFSGRLVILDRSSLSICVECEYPAR